MSKKEYALTETIHSQMSTIRKIEKVTQDQSEVKCVWEYDGLLSAFDELCLSCSTDYFKKYGLFEKEQEKITLQEAYELTSVIESYIPFFNCLLDCLVEEKYIAIEEGKIVTLRGIQSVPAAEEAFMKWKEKFPQFEAYLNLLLTCAKNYDLVFTGKILGKEIMYPNGDYKYLSSILDRTPMTTKTYMYSKVLAESLKHMASYQKDTIRILEFGAGTGLVTWGLVEALKDYNVEYWFTDIGRSFLTLAREKAREKGYDFMKFAKVDVTEPFNEQGVPFGEFDFVIGCNVIQATDDMEGALVNIKHTLKKSGTLCLLQTVRGHRIEEMMFGLSPEWWNYTKDSLRLDSPVLSYEKWTELLKRNDFTNVDILPEDNSSDFSIIFGEYAKVEESVEVHNGPMSVEEQREKIKQIQRNDVDTKLLEIILDVVGVVPDSLSQSVFEMGVDSLSGLKVSTRIRDQFKVEFSIKNLLQVQSIEELSDLISDLKVNGKVVETIKKGSDSGEKKSLEDLLLELDD